MGYQYNFNTYLLFIALSDLLSANAWKKNDRFWYDTRIQTNGYIMEERKQKVRSEINDSVFPQNNMSKMRA